MNLFAIIKVAARALGRNKLRTALTMLGIIIGVGALIVLVSIGQGAQAMVLDQISSMGTNMMYVMPGNRTLCGASRVIVLGKTVAEKLFAGVDPIGETIRVRNLPFRVVGVLAAKGQSMVGQDQDDTAVMPYSTVQRKLLGQQIPSINQAMVSAVSQDASGMTQRQITELLRQRHKIAPGQDDDFLVRNMTDAAQTFAQLT